MSDLIVFIRVLQIVFGLQNKFLFWDITHEKTTKRFPFGDIFPRTFICLHAPLLTFVAYHVSDNKVQ